jgi:RNA polymerase sigma factor (sigma-70 family)
MKLTYRELNEAISSGDDSKVLSYLYANLLPKVRNHIIRNNGSKDEANDIFQDAVIILYRNAVEGKLENVMNISGFLFQIAKNLWINRAKQSGRIGSITDRESEIASSDDSVVENMLSEEKRSALAELFALVGEKCLKLMELHLYEKKSMEEIGQLLNIGGPNAVKAQHYRCKQKLIELMDERQDLKQILKND